ncbi:MAG: uL30 family ribosomal protein [Nanoarchaeota archaeon]
MISVIRITGDVNLDGDVRETLNRLKLRRKYGCIVLNPNKEQEGMIRRVKDFVAFGEINEDTLKKLREKRGKPASPNFFRLHPPRGGIKSKFHFPRGVLGNNKDKINDLIERML